MQHELCAVYALHISHLSISVSKYGYFIHTVYTIYLFIYFIVFLVFFAWPFIPLFTLPCIVFPFEHYRRICRTCRDWKKTNSSLARLLSISSLFGHLSCRSNIILWFSLKTHRMHEISCWGEHTHAFINTKSTKYTVCERLLWFFVNVLIFIFLFAHKFVSYIVCIECMPYMPKQNLNSSFVVALISLNNEEGEEGEEGEGKHQQNTLSQQ